MKQLLILVLICSATGLWAQQSQNRNIGSFTGVKVSEAIDVYLKKGDKEALKVEITGTNMDMDDVITEISGDYLKVHLASGNYRNVTVKVYVTYVEISKLSASSASNIFADGTIKAKDFYISSSSAATVDIALEAQNVEVSASSAADVELRGKATRVEIEASSAGEVDAYDFEAEIVEVEASSAGSTKVNATKELDAHASSGGSIRYRGSPAKTNTNSSSGGSVKKSS
jgi:hypothetical protein